MLPSGFWKVFGKPQDQLRRVSTIHEELYLKTFVGNFIENEDEEADDEYWEEYATQQVRIED